MISHEDVKQTRRAVRAAAEKSSLRKLASVIGLGHSTLHNFISGAMPHPKVRRILHDWYVQQEGPGPLQPAELDHLLRDLPDYICEQVRPHLARVLAGGYAEGAIEAPAWLVELGTTGNSHEG
ncbi:hypothetical protein [Longimicrobium sp.]|uniref:hypothetical protein n=1 Tax=Longimicrobium sp. TaxID=2029185 RepID=UPI002E32C64E|nr:hypothetical protein [Longimicrobium sp.]HEX6042828.1 hypothetical protein [Longimicrobium sp.]